MPSYIATFHTHVSALRTHRALTGAGVQAVLSPVPRRLSASCGTCVRYEAATPCLAQMDADMERVVRLLDGDAYEELARND